jgi:hypothetical protein
MTLPFTPILVSFLKSFFKKWKGFLPDSIPEARKTQEKLETSMVLKNKEMDKT